MDSTARLWVGRMVMAVLCGLWVMSWIVTLNQMNVLSTEMPYLSYIALLIVVQAAPMSWLRRVLSVSVVIVALAIVAWQVTPSPILPVQWAQTELGALSNLAIHHIASANMTESLFTILLPALFGLLLYSSHYPRLWLFYQGLALVAILTIHISSAIDLLPEVLIILAAGVIGLAVQHHDRITTASIRPLQSLRLLSPAVLILLLILPIAAWLPKPGIATAKLQSALSRLLFPTHDNGLSRRVTLGPAALNRVGFTSGAQRLGGSVQLKYTPVLSVVAPYPSYLRGQVLTDYTGDGWRPGAQQVHVPVSKTTPSQRLDGTFTNLPWKNVQESVQFLGGVLHTNLLLGPYAISRWDMIGTSHSWRPSSVDLTSDTVVMAGNSTQGDRYQVMVHEPVNPYGILAKTNAPFDAVAMNAIRRIPGMSQDLELPQELPARDYRLATAVTAFATTEYEKVTSVEKYLDTHERYSLQNIPVPARGQDYVDQFLFQTHRGYCNNFSTAMAVLLRTVGIPTRWVTGFASGTEDKFYSGPMHRYVIRDSDAHSWVEVYFPTYGWIPFDPTPGFHLSFAPTGAGGQGASALQNPGLTPPNQLPPGSTPPPQPQTKPPVPHSGQSAGQHAAHLVETAGMWGLVGAVVGVGTWGLAVFVAGRRRKSKRHVQRTLARTLSRAASSPSKGMGASGEKGLLAMVSALISAHITTGRISNKGATVRDLAASAAECGLSDDEFATFVHLVERLWYSSVPLGEAESKRLYESIQRFMAGLSGELGRTGGRPG